MTNRQLKQYLINHQIHDGILSNYIDLKLYPAAINEIARVKHALELKILAIESLENLIHLTQTEQDKLDKI